MADLTDSDAQCRAKVGMLVLRDCGAEAVAACDACGRPICRAHQCPVAQGVSCPECAARDEQTARVTPAARTARRRSRWYRSHRYRPYYYGGYGHRHHGQHHRHLVCLRRILVARWLANQPTRRKEEVVG